MANARQLDACISTNANSAVGGFGKESRTDADCRLMHVPAVEQLGADVEALKHEAEMMPDDMEALLDHVAKLQMLAVLLNAHFVAPVLWD